MKQTQIAGVLTPVLAEFGLELDALEILPAGKRRLLRVVVDGDGPDGRGPNLDAIAEASKALSIALDESEAVGAAAYTLEVSSRGIGRPLTHPGHWRRNITRLVTVNLNDGDVVTGRITESDDDGVDLDIDQTQRRIAFADITKALIQVEMNRREQSEDEEI